MKKSVWIVLLLAILGLFAAPRRAEAVGIGFIVGDPTGLSLSFKPVIIGINFNFLSGNYLQFHLDYWFINRGLGSGLKWYLGLGGKLQVFSFGYGSGIGVGLRVPIGLQFFPARRVEIFLEYVPGIAIIPGVGYDHDYGIGLRFHF